MNCKICQESTTSFYDEYMECQTYHCRACQFIFKDDEAMITHDKELKVYQQHNNTEDNLGYVAMFQEFIDKTITPYKTHITTALDFGSGPNPVLANILKRNGYDVEHYDKFFSPDKVYEGKQYDLITSTEVIEHISDVQAIMTLFAKHLKPNGYLALMTQFHTNDQATYLKWWYRRDPTHIVFFRPETFRILAKQHGFALRFYDDKKLILLQKR